MNTTKPPVLDSERGQPERHGFVPHHDYPNICDARVEGPDRCGQPREAGVHLLDDVDQHGRFIPFEPPHRSEVAPEQVWVDPVAVSACTHGIKTMTAYDQNIRRVHVVGNPVYGYTRDDIARASAEDEIRRQALEEAARYVHGPQAPDHGPDLCDTLNELAEGIRALASSAPTRNASAIQTIETQRDEWQTQGWTTHVFAANEILKLLGTLSNQLNFQA